MAHYSVTHHSFSLLSHGLDEDCPMDEQEEESVFSRLIARGPTVVPHEADDTSPILRSEPRMSLGNDPNTTGLPFALPVTFVIVVAASLSSLELLFVWLSLVSTDWVQIRVFFPIGAANLAEILSELRSLHQNSVAVVLWITCLVVPCLYAVFAPSWILQLTVSVSPNPHKPTPHRILLETLLPCSLTAVYGLAVMQAILLPLHELFAVIPASAAGLFGMGVSCALVTVSLLRYHRCCNGSSTCSSSSFDRTDIRESHEAVAPMATAPLMRILEDEPVVPTPATAPSPVRRLENRPTWLCLVTMFQLGLVALFLWVPVIVYPLLHTVGNPLYYTQLMRADTATFVWSGIVPLCSTLSAALAWMVDARRWKPVVYALPPHGTVVLALVLLVVAWNADDGMLLWKQGPWWLVGQSVVAELVWLGTLAWA